jgi:SET domain
VKKSLIPYAGKGLFAMKNFKAGEVVTISPTMVMPKEQVERMSRETDSIFQNYCIASPDVSSIVLFPFGLSGIANHARANKANMEMEWHWWSENEMLMNASAEDLSRAAFAQLDIAFRAKVDILEGTELTYDYGDDWADAWANYLGELNQWHINEAWIEHAEANNLPLSSEVVDLVMPKFRSFIAGPKNFFLPHWHDQPGSSSTQERRSEFESESRADYLVQDHKNQTTGHVDIIQEIDIDPMGTVNSAFTGNSASYFDDITL